MSRSDNYPTLSEEMQHGLTAPICLTWELTYGCNLSCIHCLSSSGRRDPNELSTQEALNLVDEFRAMGIFYINIGGGEPTMRKDFREILYRASEVGIGVKFSTNGYFIDDNFARELASLDYTDVQISLDGFDQASNDAIRGAGSYERAIAAMESLSSAGKTGFKISTTVNRHNADRLDDLLSLANHYNAQLRVTRLRPSGRGALVWNDLRLEPSQQRSLFEWLSENPGVLTGDSFFHLSPFGDPLPGLNMCGAGKVVCLVDPVGDVYACPFTIHESFRAGTVRSSGGFKAVWSDSPYFESLRQDKSPSSCNDCSAYQSCQGGCMAAKYFTGLDLHGPDPECVFGRGETNLKFVTSRPTPDLSHSRRVRTAKPVVLRRHASEPFAT